MIYLFGASGHAKVIVEMLENAGVNIAGIFDNDINKKDLLGYPVFQELPIQIDDKAKVIVSVGNNQIRKKIAESLNIGFYKAIHPSANVSGRSVIGEGSVIMAAVSINSNAIIGNHVILNTNSSVDHDCVLGNYVHISPNAALAGNISVGEGTHIGIGACIIQGVNIGNWATIGAGAVIINDVPDYAVVVGNPGKIIKYNQPKNVGNES